VASGIGAQHRLWHHRPVTSGSIFAELERMNERPAPFSVMGIPELWADPHISEQMLRYHLDDAATGASRSSEFADRSVAWMTEAFDLGPGRKVVDLGCGPGQYTLRLARAGAHVTGVDVSPRSIAHAAAAAVRDGLDATHLVADYLEWEPDEQFDLALMIFNDYGAMSPEQRRRLLARVRDLLVPGGAFLFDVASLAALAEVEEVATYAPQLMNGFWAPAPYHGFMHTFAYPEERASVDRYDIVESDRTRTFWTWTQYFDPETLGAELAAGGFEIERLLGDVAGAPYDPGALEFAAVSRPVPQTR
jgi:SAM-dependent methyltransferase